MKKRKVVLLLVFTLIIMMLSGCGSSKDDTVAVSDDMITESREEASTEETDVATMMEAANKSEGAEEATSQDAKSADTATSDDAAMDEDDNINPNGENETKQNGKVIVLDPGHSSVVSGSTEPIGPGSGEMKAADSSGTRGVSTGITEYELNFTIATKLRDELVERGYTVILTREDNSTQISCSERAIIANNNNADVFLRIHADGSESSSSSGAMGICITPSNPYISGMYSESRVLSDAILNEYVAATGMSSRGVWETDTMTGNNWSQVPTTLLEMGFMTNPSEDQLMADPAFQEKMVDGIANGIDKYLFTD